jgi:peptide/nickel transport system ATP-binding protein
LTSILRVKDLSIQYERDEENVSVLEGISLSIPKGGTFGLVGESGSGKSVLLMSILGLLQLPWRITKGQILFHGEDLVAQPEKRLEEIRGKGIALMMSNPRQHLNPVMPLGRQISAILEKHQKLNKKEAVRRVIDLLKAVGIPDPQIRYHSYPHELSGGMCQRIIIAMGMANSPDLIMADEPTSGLDVTISVQILDLMHKAVRELDSALLLVSRDLGVIANYCERVAVMYAGQIVEEASVDSFFKNPVHPYARHLLRSAEVALDLEMRGNLYARKPIKDTIAKSGCKYFYSCPIALAACRDESIKMTGGENHHRVRCLRRNEIITGALQP